MFWAPIAHHQEFYVLLMMGAMDARNMKSNLAVNKYLHTVASHRNCFLCGKKDRKLELEIKYVPRIMLNLRCYSIRKNDIRLKH